MTTQDILQRYESSLSTKPSILGVPGGQLSPVEQAGELLKAHGLETARRIAVEKANQFPAAWNTWRQVADILMSARDC